jgi:hypothetical protein
MTLDVAIALPLKWKYTTAKAQVCPGYSTSLDFFVLSTPTFWHAPPPGASTQTFSYLPSLSMVFMNSLELGDQAVGRTEQIHIFH